MIIVEPQLKRVIVDPILKKLEYESRNLKIDGLKSKTLEGWIEFIQNSSEEQQNRLKKFFTNSGKLRFNSLVAISKRIDS